MVLNFKVLTKAAAEELILMLNKNNKGSTHSKPRKTSKATLCSMTIPRPWEVTRFCLPWRETRYSICSSCRSPIVLLGRREVTARLLTPAEISSKVLTPWKWRRRKFFKKRTSLSWRVNPHTILPKSLLRLQLLGESLLTPSHLNRKHLGLLLYEDDLDVTYSNSIYKRVPLLTYPIIY